MNEDRELYLNGLLWIIPAKEPPPEVRDPRKAKIDACIDRMELECWGIKP